MKNKFTQFKYSLFLLLLIISCSNSTKTNFNDEHNVSDSSTKDSLLENRFLEEVDSARYSIRLSPKGNYSKTKQTIKFKQVELKKQFLNANIEQKDSLIISVGKYIDQTLLNEIIPFWYGTPWDFSGYSQKPNEGFVGCSYFVSTTLLHSGFRLNRYHLAQQRPENEAKSLQIADVLSVFEYSEELIPNFEKNLDDGLYFVGLANHVGYLLIKKGKSFFINSSYMEPFCVEIQYAEKSAVFVSSIYYLVPIGNNKSLVKKWILGEEIEIVKPK